MRCIGGQFSIARRSPTHIRPSRPQLLGFHRREGVQAIVMGVQDGHVGLHLLDGALVLVLHPIQPVLADRPAAGARQSQEKNQPRGGGSAIRHEVSAGGVEGGKVGFPGVTVNRGTTLAAFDRGLLTIPSARHDASSGATHSGLSFFTLLTSVLTGYAVISSG